MTLEVIFMVDLPHLQVIFDLFDVHLHLLLALAIFHYSFLSDIVQYVCAPF